MARRLNLGILAHVDAGKTTLTERLLYATGVIDEIGSVDDGSTQTDTLALERRRGITIKSAVVAFGIGDVTVTLLDTPGHPDFIAEVERVLGVLDGAVLVISAVEGVQAQTRVLFRTLRRLRLPTLLFVNKIDRAGAREAGVLAEIAARLTPDVVALQTVTGAGTRSADVTPRPIPVEALADHDDGLLAAYVAGAPIDTARELAAQTASARLHPVLFGSAITGAGVDALCSAITGLLPAASGDPGGPASGTVFKVDRGPAGEKVAYARMFAGTLHVRDRVGTAKVTGIEVVERGGRTARPAVRAGEIGLLRGLSAVRIGDAIGDAQRSDDAIGNAPRSGDTIGDAPRPDDAIGDARRPGDAIGGAARSGAQFAPPTLETVVVPCRRADKGAVQAALAQLAEQDPLINLRSDDLRDEISVSLYGEVQKEVIEATLAEEYGLAVTFRESTTICIERPAGTGEAYELIDVPPNPFLATVGLRVAPAPPGSGLRYSLGVELGSMPIAFFRAVHETVIETLRQGLHGWQVTDIAVTMTRSGYWPRQSRMHGTFDKSMSSTAGDFRSLTPLVLMAALRRAGTRVYEPVHAFAAEVPADTVPAVLPALAGVRAVPLATTLHGTAAVVDGEVPAARVHDLQRLLPALTRGEGVLDSAFDRYEPVRGPAPDRTRTDANPLDRKTYLLRTLRRTSTGR